MNATRAHCSRASRTELKQKKAETSIANLTGQVSRNCEIEGRANVISLPPFLCFSVFSSHSSSLFFLFPLCLFFFLSLLNVLSLPLTLACLRLLYSVSVNMGAGESSIAILAAPPNSKVLVAYATHYNSTKEIAESIVQTLRDQVCSAFFALVSFFLTFFSFCSCLAL